MCIDKHGKQLSVLPLTQEILKYLVRYNPDTGVFTWKVSINPRCKVGDIIATKHQDGYIKLTLNKRQHALHRLAFLYMLNSSPAEVDHINNIRNDNRWRNLRAATKATNQHNALLRSDNTSGIKGVCYDKRLHRYVVRIYSNKIPHRASFPISNFNSKEDALQQATIYAKQLREKLHGTFTNHG